MLFSLEMKKNGKKEMSIVGHDEHGFVLQLVQNSGSPASWLALNFNFFIFKKLPPGLYSYSTWTTSKTMLAGGGDEFDTNKF